MKISVETVIDAPLDKVWECYVEPDHITNWNFASEDWHCPASSVDLRVGGEFSSRMEAKDGSMGFDFAGTYTKIETGKLLEYEFGDRNASIEFSEEPHGVKVTVTFDAESQNPEEMQRSGWQAILNNFRSYVSSLRSLN